MLVHVAIAAGAAPASAQDGAEPRVIVALLPFGTTVEEIGAVDGIAPGILSAGIGQVSAPQTYLDIGQGNRVNESLYDDPLPLLLIRGGRVPRGLWRETTDRAAAAPANLVPGLLASTIASAGDAVHWAAEEERLWALIAVDRTGTVPAVPPARCGLRGCGAGLTVLGAQLSDLAPMIDALGPADLLIALPAAPSPDRRLLPIGLAGDGFAGNLTSGSTRTDGLVITSDIAPTVLERLGIEVPGAMNGTLIRAEGQPDPAGLADYQEQLVTRPGREVVIIVPLLIWLALAGIAALAMGERAARLALPLIALGCAWGLSLLLAAAALDASTLASALILGVGAIALAAATMALVPRYRGLALACGVAVVAHGVDAVAGSPLIALSVLGPNPSGGVRFFGIGNEHAASLVPMAMIGTGALLGTLAVSARAAAATFLAVALVVGAAYAPGAFGASVGTAIMLAAGGTAAAAITLGLSARGVVALIVGGIVAGVAALAAVDLATGNAHLTRTVLGAEEGSELLDAFERRLRLMVGTFTNPVWPQLFGATVVLLIVGLVNRAGILAWFGDRHAARAGFLGALVAIAVGSVANDSGSVLLVIGTIYLTACGGFFWGSRPVSEDGPPSTTAAGSGRPGADTRTASRTGEM